MRIVVLGASGFLGSWVTRALLAAGHEVTAPLRSAAPWRLEGLPLDRIEVVDEASRRRAIRRSGAESLISLDWTGVSGPDRDGDAQRLNVERLHDSLRTALHAGIGRIVVAGSQAELAPVTTYGRAKVEALGIFQQLAAESGADWHWARVFSVFGPMDHPTTLLSRLAAAGSRREPIEVSSGRMPWSFLDAADAATAFLLLATGDTPSGVVNVASPSAPPLRHSIETFTTALAAPPEPAFGPRDNQALSADVTPLTEAGWTPAVDVDAQLRRAAAWYSGQAVPDPFVEGLLLPRAPRSPS